MFITHINAPEEMVIAGDPGECRQVISDLGCRSHSVPVPHLFHTPVIGSEKDALRSLLRFPVRKSSGIRLYTSFNSKTLTLDSDAIADDITESLLQPVDFQHLVKSIHRDGANVFIELGPANTCTRWISEILKGTEHIAVAMNIRGADERSSVVKALAKLICFGVDLDFSFVYRGSRKTFHKFPENMECLFRADDDDGMKGSDGAVDIGGYRTALESKLLELCERRLDLDKEHMQFLRSRHAEFKDLHRHLMNKRTT